MADQTHDVRLPDGTIVRNVPVGTTRQQLMDRVGRSRFAPPPGDPGMRNPSDTRPGLSGTANVATAGTDPLNRFLRGLEDVPVGMAQLVANALPDEANVAMGGKTAEQINMELAQREAEYQAGRLPESSPARIESYMAGESSMPDNPEMDWWRLGGNVTGSLPLAALGGESLAGQAAAGGLIGLTTPDYSGGGDFWENKLEQGLLGGVGGAGGAIAGRGLASAIAPRVRPEVQMLMERGVTPTPGQILGGGWNATEQKLQSLWGVGDAISSSRDRAIREFNRAVYDDVLRPIGGTVPDTVGREAIDDISEQVSRAYEDLLPATQFTPDQQLLADLSGPDMQIITQQMLPDTAARMQREFGNFLGNVRTGNPISGEEFKRLESTLTNRIGQLQRGTAEEQLYGDAVELLRDALRANLARSNQGLLIQVENQTVDVGQRLSDINNAFARLVRLQRASGAAGSGDGVFSADQFLSAVRMSDRSARRNQYARGNALMQDLAESGKDVLGRTVPDSGTAGRLATGLTGVALGSNPWLAVPGLLATGPYLGAGSNVAAGLLTRRPQVAEFLAQRVRDALPGGVAAGASIATQPSY